MALATATGLGVAEKVGKVAKAAGYSAQAIKDFKWISGGVSGGGAGLTTHAAWTHYDSIYSFWINEPYKFALYLKQTTGALREGISAYIQSLIDQGETWILDKYGLGHLNN